MSLSNKDHLLSAAITDAMIAKSIAQALRHEHANVTPAIMQIEKITGIKAITARKWYNGKHVPRSRHLLTLALYYPQVLQAICELMGIGALWQEMARSGIIDKMQTHLDEKWGKWKKQALEVDRFVHIHVRLNAHVAVQMNQRQLWFLGQLQQGYKMQAGDLVDIWHVHTKTAKRDVLGLLEAELIVPMKTGRNCRYKLL